MVVILATDLLEYLRIDDPIGAVPVHFFGGIWGTLSLGLFAAGKYFLPTPTGADVSSPVIGLLYGGGARQLFSQAIGSGSVIATTLLASFALFYAVKLTGTLRVSAVGEIEGLDLHEHGAAAYPEYVLNGKDGTPKFIPAAKGLSRVNMPEVALVMIRQL